MPAIRDVWIMDPSTDERRSAAILGSNCHQQGAYRLAAPWQYLVVKVACLPVILDTAAAGSSRFPLEMMFINMPVSRKFVAFFCKFYLLNSALLLILLGFFFFFIFSNFNFISSFILQNGSWLTQNR